MASFSLSFFTSQTFQEELVIPVSFPDVNGALAPTIRTALVNAISAFRIAEITSFTHKAFPQMIDAALDFPLPITSRSLNLLEANLFS